MRRTSAAASSSTSRARDALCQIIGVTRKRIRQIQNLGTTEREEAEAQQEGQPAAAAG
jgi:hypothetical protein